MYSVWLKWSEQERAVVCWSEGVCGLIEVSTSREAWRSRWRSNSTERCWQVVMTRLVHGVNDNRNNNNDKSATSSNSNPSGKKTEQPSNHQRVLPSLLLENHDSSFLQKINRYEEVTRRSPLNASEERLDQKSWGSSWRCPRSGRTWGAGRGEVQAPGHQDCTIFFLYSEFRIHILIFVSFWCFQYLSFDFFPKKRTLLHLDFQACVPLSPFVSLVLDPAPSWFPGLSPFVLPSSGSSSIMILVARPFVSPY